MIVLSIITLTGLGFVAASLLAFAAKVFYVEEDPRVGAVLDALPGANCGGCGYAGCEGYAIAVVNVPSIEANLCVAGGSDVSVAVGELTGKTVKESEPLITFRRCDKIKGNVRKRYNYQGMPSCAAAATLAQGVDFCAHSCLGFGDCVEACPFDALYIMDNVVYVRENLCIGCGKCTHSCPRDILQLIPKRARVTIMCSSRDKMRAVTDVCDIGCIKCGKCIKACPAGAIEIKDNKIINNQTKCLAYGPDCDEACVIACPRSIIRSSSPKSCNCKDGNCEKQESAENQVEEKTNSEQKTQASESINA